MKYTKILSGLLCLSMLTACGGKKTNDTESSAQSSGTILPQENADKGSDAAGSGVLKNETESTNAYSADLVLEAALTGNIALVRKALSSGFDVNATDPEGHSPLMMAAYNGHSEIIRLLLKEGAIPDARDAAKRTALMYASTGPFNESVVLLLDAGADPNLVDNEEHFTALMFAAAEGQAEVVRTLLEHGADKTKVDVDGDSAYDFAVNNGHTETAELVKP